MAVIKRIPEGFETGNNRKIILEIDNGDLEAIEEVMGQYRFVNEQALLRYALFSLIQSSDNKLYVKSDNAIVSVNIEPTLITPGNIE